jgi:pseudaminic acid cytidylyltransferase
MKIAIIPARGGSKRIPRKNIKLFAGKPMLEYAIMVAKKSNLFDAVVVSSDDQEILNLATQLNVTPLLRPLELANDTTPTVPVIAHAIKMGMDNWNWQPSAVCCIYPAVPFLQSEALVEGFTLLEQVSADYVFPLVMFPTVIQRALRLAKDGKVSAFSEEYYRYQDKCTQDIEPAYHDAGQFYWGKPAAWLEGKNIHLNSFAFTIPYWRVVDIDTPDDWVRAELIQQSLMVKEIL